MSLKRPPHLIKRTIQGRAFSEILTIIRVVGERDRYGEYHEVETATETLCATAPMDSRDPRAREITEGGILLSAIRRFWTIEILPTVSEGNSAGDIVEYLGERWRVSESQRWGDFSESVGRQEAQ